MEFLVIGTWRVVTCDTTDRTILHIRPKTVHLFLGTQRRSTFKEWSVFDNVLIRHAQVMGTCLGCNVISLLLCFFNFLCHIRAADMTNMRFASRRFCNLDNIHGSQHLRNHGSGVKVSLPVKPSLFNHSLLLPLDCGKVLTMKSRSSSKFLNPLHCLICLPIT